VIPTLQQFKKEVLNKFQIYNSLFSNLPYEKMENIGSLIPILYKNSKEGFENNKTPIEIIDDFFQTNIKTNSEKIKQDYLFRMIQYIERQVVLFDSIEDASFEQLHDENEEGTLPYLLQSAILKEKLSEVKEKLRNFKVRLVFTAHPTQFYPQNVLRIIYYLEQAIKENNLSEIDAILQQLGQTPFINNEKPTPFDEALSIIYFMRNVYYDTLGKLQQDIQNEFFADENLENTNIELGFWPGGDRDGNPFVTAEITKKVTQELRFNIMKCYYNDIKRLMRKITFKESYTILSVLNKKIYNNMFGLSSDIKSDEILNALLQVKSNIIERNNSLFLNELDLVIQKVKLFNVHFASLDIRQDSSIHFLVLEEVSRKKGTKLYSEMNSNEKIQFLLHSNITVKAEDFENELIQDTFKNISQLREIQSINGEKAVNRYIISNSTTMLNVLEVLGLFKMCNYTESDIKFDIIPLFETIEGLENAENVMQELYNFPYYKEHLEKRNNAQTIMLGFSDGTKDGGYVKANAKIFEAKEELTAVSRRNNISVIFFDGRGGPPARGGGKTHQFYASQGNTIENNEIQLTIQGQTISSMYGSKPQAFYNLSQLLTSGLHNTIFPISELNSSQNALINELAEISNDKYEELKKHPKFISYLENRSTLKYYGRTNIGSRPSKRGKDDKLEFSDLRAIPFVGSWSLLKQNVPGYFGFGTSIQKLIDDGKLAELQQIYIQSGFFKTLVQNSMMAMCKSYFPLTSYMKTDTEYGEFWQILYDEFELSKTNLLKISQMNELMEDSPINKISIDYREKIILPLLTIQQYALQKIEKGEEVEIYEKIVTRALFGNINASRNSA